MLIEGSAPLRSTPLHSTSLSWAPSFSCGACTTEARGGAASEASDGTPSLPKGADAKSKLSSVELTLDMGIDTGIDTDFDLDISRKSIQFSPSSPAKSQPDSP